MGGMPTAEYMRAYRSDPARRARHNELSRLAIAKLSPEGVAAKRRREWERALQTRYGITVEDYERMLAEQGGRCKVTDCRRLPGKRRLDVDHNHQTGEVRGLLCRRCNLQDRLAVKR